MADPEKPFRPAHPNWSAKVFGDVLNNGHLRVFATRATWETAELHKTEALANPLRAGWLPDCVRFEGTTRDAALSPHPAKMPSS